MNFISRNRTIPAEVLRRSDDQKVACKSEEITCKFDRLVDSIVNRNPTPRGQN